MSTPIAATIDVRQIARPARHPLIFGTFDKLQPGEAMQLVNDHDPLPLQAHFESRTMGRFTWDYLEAGPDVWRVNIGKTSDSVGAPAKAGAAAGNCCSGGACGGG